MFESYFEESILSRAKESKLIELNFLNPRDFSKNRHKKVDEYQVGGGAGLVMLPEPIDRAIRDIKEKNEGAHTIFLTPSGKTFTQKDAIRLASKEHLILVCGRYEGFDERAIELHADEVFSIGDYILTGGELAAMVVCDAVSRHIKGVLGNEDSLEGESFESALLEAPTFTKPNDFNGNCVPSEFLKGNHGKIAGLKKSMSLNKTKFYRPDLYERYLKDKG